MEDEVKLLQNADGTYRLRGLRFGETETPQSQTFKIGKHSKLSSIYEAPSR